MTRTSASPSSPACCRYRTPTGRQCRQLVLSANEKFCPKHSAPQFLANPVGDFRKLLTTDADEFTTAMGIHNSLSELYKLLAADLISARRAAVLAYIANLLLRTIPVVHSELNPDAENGSTTVDVNFGDLPRPNRGPVSTPAELAPGETPC